MELKRYAVLYVSVVIVAGCVAPAKQERAAVVVPPPGPPSASDVAREAAQRNPVDPERQYRLGNALFDLGRYGEAKAAYAEVVRLDPNRAAAHTNLGLCLKRLGQNAEAISEYRAALAIDPADEVTLRNLAAALDASGDYAAAAEPLQRLAELHPDDVQVLSRWARARYRAGQYEEAAKTFEKVLRLTPGAADDFYNLGLCYVQIERWDAAATAWLTVLAHEPRHPAAHQGLAALYWKRGDYEQAWAEVVNCQALGIHLSPGFVADLQRDSGRTRPK